jgi:hypothetical protein
MLVVSARAAERQKMKYLVTASEGPGWSTPEEALKVLKKGVLPTFDILLKLEAEKRIVAGGTAGWRTQAYIHFRGVFQRGG